MPAVNTLKRLAVLAMARCAITFPLSGTGSAAPTQIGLISGLCSRTFLLAYNLPVHASQRPSPDATQDSVRGCRLSFAAVAISGDKVSCACKAPYERDSRIRLLPWGFDGETLVRPRMK